MQWCTASGGIPCRALSTPCCFGQPVGWRFSIAETDPKWKRKLERHHAQHDSFQEQSATLCKQADMCQAVDMGKWQCLLCKEMLSTTGKAVQHACRTKRGSLTTAMAPTGKRVRTAPANLGSVPELIHSPEADRIPPMPELAALYASHTRLFAEAHARTADLRFVHATSLVNAARIDLPACTEPQVGDVFEWPGQEDVYACIVSLAKFGRAHVFLFYRRPLKSAQTCGFHPLGGGCWRCRAPLQSQLLKVPWPFDRSLALVPRAASPEGSKDFKMIHQRCFQLVSADDTVTPDVSGREILRLVQASAEHAATSATCQAEVGSQDANAVGAVTAGPAAAAQQGSSLWTQAVAQLYSAAVHLPIDFVCPPATCPNPANRLPCRIVGHGIRASRMHVSATGCRRLLAHRYLCHVHQRSFQAPSGTDSLNCIIVGDFVGDYLIAGDVWTEALSAFQDTENFRHIEKLLRRRTTASLLKAVPEHTPPAGFSELEGTCLHSALCAFACTTPGYRTIKEWFMVWVKKLLGPLIPRLALAVCASHGAIGNLDFSASDARQLRAIGSKTRKQKEHRTFGGLTGLADVPLLPDLYATAEDRPNTEAVLLVWMRLLQIQGLRPVGANVDNIAKEFKTVVGCLDAAFPGAVRYDKIALKRSQAHVQAGGIVVDLHARKVTGFELGQDALHVYKRLLRAINTTSVDTAWAIRCLRKWLGSLNPEVRFCRANTEPVSGGADSRHVARAPLKDAAPVNACRVLELYFRGRRCLLCLSMCSAALWRKHGCTLSTVCRCLCQQRLPCWRMRHWSAIRHRGLVGQLLLLLFGWSTVRLDTLLRRMSRRTFVV